MPPPPRSSWVFGTLKVVYLTQMTLVATNVLLSMSGRDCHLQLLLVLFGVVTLPGKFRGHCTGPTKLAACSHKPAAAQAGREAAARVCRQKMEPYIERKTVVTTRQSICIKRNSAWNSQF